MFLTTGSLGGAEELTKIRVNSPGAWDGAAGGSTFGACTAAAAGAEGAGGFARGSIAWNICVNSPGPDPEPDAAGAEGLAVNEGGGSAGFWAPASDDSCGGAEPESKERKNIAVALSGSSCPWRPGPELKSFSAILGVILLKSQQRSLRDYTPCILA